MHHRMLVSAVHVGGSEYNKLQHKSIDGVKRTDEAIDIPKAVEEAASSVQNGSY